MSDNLAETRFVSTPESRDAMRSLGSVLKDLQREYPQIQGLGYFGSRTLGREHAGSDLDTIVFYDNSGFKGDFVARARFGKVVEEALEKKMAEYGIPIIKSETEDSIGFDDISREGTDRKLRKLEESPGGKGLGFTDLLAPRFFLSIGDGLYQNRAYILGKLSRMDGGEKIFRQIMGYLQLIERKGDTDKRTRLPEYSGYPKTIEEARKYFLLRPDPVTELLKYVDPELVRVISKWEHNVFVEGSKIADEKIERYINSESSISQIYGASGLINRYLAQAKAENRDLNSEEIEQVKEAFAKAAESRGVSPIFANDKDELLLLSQNIPLLEKFRNAY